MSEDAKSRLNKVEDNIARAARLSGRRPEEVELIAVSKTHDAAAILPLLETGHRRFGENRVQEAQTKWPDLLADYPDTELHLVGQLQSNKAEDAVALFDVLHSVDRPSLITAISMPRRNKASGHAASFRSISGTNRKKGGAP